MSGDKPKPQIFAIMRNGHEVIRGGMVDMKDAIAKDDMEAAKEIWTKLFKFIEIHKTMEEGNGNEGAPPGFFKILDEKREQTVTKNGLYDLHLELDKQEAAVASACKDSDLDALKAVFSSYMELNEGHLKKEEEVMMPSLQQMMKAGEPMKKFMVQDILPLVAETPDFEFFVKYANEVLEKHHGGMPRARVFDHALWAASSPELWAKCDAWIKETLTDSTYTELQKVLPAAS